MNTESALHYQTAIAFLKYLLSNETIHLKKSVTEELRDPPISH